jgi:hypothetical protein
MGVFEVQAMKVWLRVAEGSSLWIFLMPTRFYFLTELIFKKPELDKSSNYIFGYLFFFKGEKS